MLTTPYRLQPGWPVATNVFSYGAINGHFLRKTLSKGDIWRAWTRYASGNVGSARPIWINFRLAHCPLLFLRNPEVLQERIMKRQWPYRLGAGVGRATSSYSLGSDFELSSVYQYRFFALMPRGFQIAIGTPQTREFEKWGGLTKIFSRPFLDAGIKTRGQKN